MCYFQFKRLIFVSRLFLKMPRTKTKRSAKLSKDAVVVCEPNLPTEDFRNDIKDVMIKSESMDEVVPVASGTAPDLSQFKFQKKPHVKIEFEKDSPTEQDVCGLWEPPNWREFLLNLRNMRSNNDAPVDTMGCHMAMDENATPEVMRYQSLIALMLSSQTKDQVTFAAMERLRAHGLTVDNVLKMTDDELGKLIYPVGFWKTKVKYIKKTTQTLKEQYNSDIPDSVEKLCKLTGVGPKMAHICMKVAWNKITGIGVDTHVHRISNRIGWVKKPTSTPEDTRKALQTWLPFELWSEVNHLMVGFGQTICLPVSPICNECLNRDICPSSGKGRKSPKKTPTKQEVKSENQELLEQEKYIPRLKLEAAKPNNMKLTHKNDKQGAEENSTVKKTNKTTNKKVIKRNVPDDDNNGIIGDFKVPVKILKSPTIKGKQNVDDKSDTKRAPIKRKSPRNKLSDSSDTSSVDTVVHTKKTRIVKK